jgi:hypothetical protein
VAISINDDVTVILLLGVSLMGADGKVGKEV